MRLHDSTRAFLKVAIALSTFCQDVFCVRMAPTMTSNGVRAGHHP
jgi:hypothetical protein